MTRDEINGIQIGTMVQWTIDTRGTQPLPGARWSKPEPVVEIVAREDSITGKRFIIFYHRFGDDARMSHSVMEGEGHVRIAP